MKQHPFSVLPLLLALCLTLTACGASSSVASSAPAAATPGSNSMLTAAEMEEVGMVELAADAAAAPIAAGGQSNAAPTSPVDSRKIVRDAELSLETKEFDQAIASLTALVTDHGGYLQNQSIRGRSMYQEGYSRRASMTARVPADRLDAVVNAAGGICNIVSREFSADDITDRYFDSEAHLRSLELQEERLLEILSKAQRLEDVIDLEQALSEVRYQIEALTASLRRMDNQVAYSTLSLELTEVVEYQPSIGQSKSFGERIFDAWGRSCARIGYIAEGLLFFAIESLPSILLFLGLPILLLVLLLRAVRRRKKPLSPPPAPEKKDT